MLRLICWLMAPIGMFLPMFGSSFGGCSPFTTSLASSFGSGFTAAAGMMGVRSAVTICCLTDDSHSVCAP
jgi:hypothetical protein